MTIAQSEIDIAGNPSIPQARSRAAILEMFETNVAQTRAVLTGSSDAELLAPWTLKRGAQVVFTMPKLMVWRSFVMNHLVHHRGQLALYLRMNDVPVPSIYGPSADESTF